MTADSRRPPPVAPDNHPVAPDDSDGEVLTAPQLQVVELPDGVLLKRGATEFAVTGAGAAGAVRHIYAMIAQGGATRSNILARVPAGQRSEMAGLLDGLLARRLAMSACLTNANGAESSEDIFYWHFETTAGEVRKRLASIQVSVVGVNELSRQMCGLLSRCGFTRVEIIDDPALRGERFFTNEGLRAESWPRDAPPPISLHEWVRRVVSPENGELLDVETSSGIRCVVPASDFGGAHAFRAWNQLCLRSRWHLFPVLLQDLIGYVGPLVLPYETACYECLRARQNANLVNPDLRRAAEYHAGDGQQVIASLPSMTLTIAGFAATELLKFYGQVPQWHAGHLVEINLLAPDLTARRVLRVPRCSECSAMNRTSSISPDKFDYQDLSPSALANLWQTPD